jgi:hypothetical protein
MLKMGPASVPVTAISPYPLLVMATSAVISPRQLPQATMVNARREAGNPVTKPNVYSRDTIILELN